MAVTAVPAAAAIGGSIISSEGAKSAAKTQANAANNATQLQQNMFNTTQQNLQPYMGIGNKAVTALTSGTGLDSSNPLSSQLLKPITMDEATLQQTPGYQFNLNQGLKAVQNSAAKRGLGVSGAAEKGAAAYATGLADNTYQNQFNNAVTNQTNQFNRLNTLVGGGQNAAAGLGGIGQQTGANIASTISGAGNAQAASQISGANALGSGLTSAGNTYAATAGNNGLYGNTGSVWGNSSSNNSPTFDQSASHFDNAINNLTYAPNQSYY